MPPEPAQTEVQIAGVRASSDPDPIPYSTAPEGAHVLVVDHQFSNLLAIRRALLPAGYVVRNVSGPAGVRKVPDDWPVNLILLGMQPATGTAGALLRAVRAAYPESPVIAYSTKPNVEEALACGRLGAADYLGWPVRPVKLLDTLRGAVRDGSAPPGLVAASRAMRAVARWIGRIGPTTLPALVLGETGTGKELVARAIHRRSDRADRPLVVVDCGSIPEGLFESELFGHRTGAFTGAVTDSAGLLRAADGGTLFLDEVGELPLSMQARFLRFLENGEVRALGDVTSRRVDVRIVATTQRELGSEVTAGRFRRDLYFRLNAAVCRLPPLRDRPEDVDALVETWLPAMARRMGREVRGTSRAAGGALRRYEWPGNVRELKNVLAYLASVTTGSEITLREVEQVMETPSRTARRDRGASGNGQEDELLSALARHRWNRGATAASLGVSRTTLWRRLRRAGIAAGSSRGEKESPS